MARIFISYRRTNWPFTRQLADELSQRLDAEIFVDFTGIDETDFERAILRNLRASDAVLLVISEHTFSDRIHRDDDWVRREIREALTYHKPLILVCVDGLLPPPDLPDDIKDVARMQGINFYPEYFTHGVERLAEFIIKVGAAHPRTFPVAAPKSPSVIRRSAPKPRAGRIYWRAGIVIAVVLIVAVILVISTLSNGGDKNQDDATDTRAAQTYTPEITAPAPDILPETQAWLDLTTTYQADSTKSTATVIAKLTGTPRVTPTPDPLQAALERARNFSGSNDDWKPFTWNFDGVEMVLVPVGCFMMGDNTGYENEKPAHRVCFEDPFWVDHTEVTNGQFAAFNGQAVASSFFSGDDRPREQITWTEAQAFCRSRGARLPTEAEWEYAARGPEDWKYPWGNEFSDYKAIWNRSPEIGTASVRNRRSGASWVGAIDMSGNVWEWVSDWYDSEYYKIISIDDIVNPIGPRSGTYRVLRGGSWYETYLTLLRTTYRYFRYPADWSTNFGFRCARSADS